MNPELLDRTPPNDLDAERAVIGSCLLEPSRIDDLAEFLSAEDFYAFAHATLWGRLRTLSDAGSRIDTTLLMDALRRAGELEAIGGSAYLLEILQSVPVAAHAAYYAGVVAKMATFRRIILAGTEMVRSGYDVSIEPTKALDAAESTLRSAWSGDRDDGVVSMEAAAIEALEQIYEARDRHTGRGLMTGLRKYDEVHGGFFPDELILIAARPGLGKTAIAVQIAHYAASHSRAVLFVSLEMSAPSLALRLLCSLAGVSSREVRTGSVSEESAEALSEAGKPLGGIPFWMAQRANTTPTAIRRVARRLGRKHPLSLIVVDYIQRVTPVDRKLPRHEQVGEVSGAFKSLAIELHVPVLCLAQLNREADKDDRARLSHLGESHKLEEDSDVIVRIRQEADEADDPWTPVKCTLHVLKNRNGETGDINVYWTPASTRFECDALPQDWNP